jgi:hypothetical protein
MHPYPDDLDDSSDLRDWLTRVLAQWQRMREREDHADAWDPRHGAGLTHRKRHHGWSVLGGAVLLITIAVVAITLAVLYWPNGRVTTPPIPLYAQRAVSIHSARSDASAIVRTLALGDSILATPPDAGHWMEVSEPGEGPIGYAYDSSEFLAPNPPPDAQPAGEPSPPTVRDSTREPVAEEPAPTDTTAICKDGWISQSKHRSGTCSSHKGVLTWVHRPPS